MKPLFWLLIRVVFIVGFVLFSTNSHSDITLDMLPALAVGCILFLLLFGLSTYFSKDESIRMPLKDLLFCGPLFPIHRHGCAFWTLFGNTVLVGAFAAAYENNLRGQGLILDTAIICFAVLLDTEMLLIYFVKRRCLGPLVRGN
jgi:hypothetical protein